VLSKKRHFEMVGLIKLHRWKLMDSGLQNGYCRSTYKCDLNNIANERGLLLPVLTFTAIIVGS